MDWSLSVTITTGSQYRNVCRISRAKFAALLRERANPALLAERSPEAYYDAIMAYRNDRGDFCDPLYVLAMFGKESTFGRNGVAVTSKSWGNTRAPNFGATPTGEMPGRTGTFPIWANWLDGCISTVARLLATNWYYTGEERTIEDVNIDPHYPNRNPNKPAQAPIPRENDKPIEWAPAGDLNSPEGYLSFVLRFMNDHADMDKEQPMAPLKVALAAGHYNTDGGNPVEISLVGHHCNAAVKAFREAGADVRCITPNEGLSNFPGGLQAVARHVVEWANQGWTADIFIEFHTEGVGNPNVRGVFVIYPDTAPDIDADVRDKLGPDMAKRVAANMGIPVRGNGTMSERNTYVGLQGHRLGAFFASSLVRATTTRLLIESGAHSSPVDLAVLRQPDTPRKIARGVVDAVYAFYGRQADWTDQPDDLVIVPKSRYFLETKHYLNHGFCDYWETKGGLSIFGYPLSEEFINVDGITVQWFERARFEYHPNNPEEHRILLGRIGAESLEIDREQYPDAFEPCEP